MIYFIQGKEGTPIKVGYTGNDSVDSRIKTLQTGYPYALRTLLELPDGTEDEERLIHSLLSEDRLLGEWFEHSERVDVLIGRLRACGLHDGIREFMALAVSIEASPNNEELYATSGTLRSIYDLPSAALKLARDMGDDPKFIEVWKGARIFRYYSVNDTKRWLRDRNMRCRANWYTIVNFTVTAASILSDQEAGAVR